MTNGPPGRFEAVRMRLDEAHSRVVGRDDFHVVPIFFRKRERNWGRRGSRPYQLPTSRECARLDAVTGSGARTFLSATASGCAGICSLPEFPSRSRAAADRNVRAPLSRVGRVLALFLATFEIGRASCRERVWISVV